MTSTFILFYPYMIMHNKLIVPMVVVLVVLISPIAFANDVIWSFDNFDNHYKVYGSTNCKVDGTKTCRNELSWEGNKIGFSFLLNKTQPLSDYVKFSFDVVYFAYYNEKKPYANIRINANGKKITEFPVNSQGVYSAEIPKSMLKLGKKNTIQIAGTNINPGYGHYQPTVVLGYVELSNE